MAFSRLPDPAAGLDDGRAQSDRPSPYAHLFQVGKTINCFDPVGGNHTRLMQDSNASIDATVTDIDAARGVACRAIADDPGSRTMIHSEQWRSMREAGVLLAAASRSYYADPLAGGANIFGCRGGLLHSKTLTLGGEVTLTGSANMDRRSFERDNENDILLHDRALTAEVDQRHRQSGTGALSGGTRREWVPGAVAHQRVSLFRPINPATQ